jgi:hypothetical protein
MEVGSLDELVSTARSRDEARSATKPKFKKGKEANAKATQQGKPTLRQPTRKSQC